MFGERRRCVDETVSETGGGKGGDFFGKLAERDGRELWGFRVAGVPPGRKGVLGVGVDNDDGAVLGAFGCDREACGESSLAAAAFLGSDNDGFHWVSRGLG